MLYELPNYQKLYVQSQELHAEAERKIKDLQITIRDQFAMAALANSNLLIPQRAEVAYAIADKMIIARQTKKD